VAGADAAGGVLAARHAEARAPEDDVEVHAEDAGGGVVLDTEIDVLGDAEAEVAELGEVALLELVLLDLQDGR